MEIVFHFDTAWSPPTPIIKNAAERFPALTFELRYFECGCCFNGLFRLSRGEVESDESSTLFRPPGRMSITPARSRDWALTEGEDEMTETKLDFCRFLGFSGGRPPC